MENFNQLKKELQEGRYVILKSVEKEEPGPKMVERIGRYRQIIKKQTNAIKFIDGSWLGLGSTGEKAKDFQFYNNDCFSYEDEYIKLNYQIKTAIAEGK